MANVTLMDVSACRPNKTREIASGVRSRSCMACGKQTRWSVFDSRVVGTGGDCWFGVGFWTWGWGWPCWTFPPAAATSSGSVRSTSILKSAKDPLNSFRLGNASGESVERSTWFELGLPSRCRLSMVGCRSRNSLNDDVVCPWPGILVVVQTRAPRVTCRRFGQCAVYNRAASEGSDEFPTILNDSRSGHRRVSMSHRRANTGSLSDSWSASPRVRSLLLASDPPREGKCSECA